MVRPNRRSVGLLLLGCALQPFNALDALMALQALLLTLFGPAGVDGDQQEWQHEKCDTYRQKNAHLLTPTLLSMFNIRAYYPDSQ